MKTQTNKPRLKNVAGVGVLELLLVLTLVLTISAFALTNFQASSRSLNLSGATRSLSAYLEKARTDSVRRHGGASMDINSTLSYTANIDFIGDGTTTARTISLPPGTSLSYSLPPDPASMDPSIYPITITYDWRGRATSTVFLTLTDSNLGVGSSTVVVGPEGDLSTETTVTGPAVAPTPQNTGVTTTTGIKSMQY